MTEATAELPVLRRADCSHGFVPGDTKPNALDHAGRELYLCAACRLTHGIETKQHKSDSSGETHHAPS